MHKAFKIVGWIEGISLLLLFFYAMPMKYVYGDPRMVRVVGSAHGGLFLAYVLLAFVLYDRESWPQKKLVLALVLSSVPFGTFIFEHKYLEPRA
jgi:integral membrane protein